MRLGIVGSRTFSDYWKLREKIINTFDVNKISVVVSGGAIGTDTLAEKFAEEFNIPKLIYLPDWKHQGKKAGFLRNKDIVDSSDCLAIFWDMKSKGTEHSMKLAIKQKKPYVLFSTLEELNLTNEFK